MHLISSSPSDNKVLMIICDHIPCSTTPAFTFKIKTRYQYFKLQTVALNSQCNISPPSALNSIHQLAGLAGAMVRNISNTR